MKTMTVRGLPWASHIMQVAYDLGRDYRRRGIEHNPYKNISSQPISRTRVEALIGAFENGWMDEHELMVKEAM